MRCRKRGVWACSSQLLSLHSPNSSGPLMTDKVNKISPPWSDGQAHMAQQRIAIQGAADEFPAATTVEFRYAILFHCAHYLSDHNFGVAAGTKAQSTAGPRSNARSGNDRHSHPGF